MSDLISEKCEACQIGAPRVEGEERNLLGRKIPDWGLREVDGIERLSRSFKFENYERAVRFTNQVADLAESEDHHPALLLEWGRVTVEWWTHKIEGLHRNDYICAAKTDELYQKF